MQSDRYSRMVGWLKVMLPLMALALLSTLFLLSRKVDPEAVIPFADKEIQDRLRDQQVTGPVYHSVTADGDELSFSAQKLTTPNQQISANEAEDVEITMTLASGTMVTLTAARGRFDIGADEADLQNDVVIDTSTGYRLLSDRLITRFSTVVVTSPGPVAGDSPFGTLNAGSMQLDAGTGESTAQLVFTNGVKLVYTPKLDKE